MYTTAIVPILKNTYDNKPLPKHEYTSHRTTVVSTVESKKIESYVMNKER